MNKKGYVGPTWKKKQTNIKVGQRMRKQREIQEEIFDFSFFRFFLRFTKI